jgi:hypothetical protein
MKRFQPRAWRARRLLSIALCAAPLALAPACLTPPVMMPAPGTNLARAIEFYPPGAHLLELPTKDGATLRGVFVPASEGAPVVLHLLGAAQSPGSLAQPIDGAAWSLADAGIASLIVDYRGVGASSGKRDVGLLGADAERMWSEAVRLAGGDPSRVAIRATSLGTIAAALLLKRGARPGAALLVAPVFPDTVVERFARDSYGLVAGWFAALAYRSVADVDVVEELTRSGAPVCVTLFKDDRWAAPAQISRLFEAVRKTPWHSWQSIGGDHVGGVLFTTALTESERSFLGRIDTLDAATPRNTHFAMQELTPEVRAQLEASAEARSNFQRLAERFALVPADQLAAAALEHEDGELAEEWIGALRHVPKRGATFEELRALYAHGGDRSDVLTYALHGLAFFGGDLVRRGVARDATGWDEPRLIATNVAALRRDRPEVQRVLLGRGAPGRLTATWTPTPLVEGASSDVEFRRILARAALKSSGRRERLVVDESGEKHLEYLDDDVWRELDCGAPRQAAAHVAP